MSKVRYVYWTEGHRTIVRMLGGPGTFGARPARPAPFDEPGSGDAEPGKDPEPGDDKPKKKR